MGKFFIALGIVVLIILLLIAGPIFSIWSLNLLFGLSIPVTLKTWLSALWFMVLGGSSFKTRKK